MGNLLARLNGGSGAFAVAAVCVLLIAAGYLVQNNRSAPEETDEVALVAPSEEAVPLLTAVPVEPQADQVAPAAEEETAATEETPTPSEETPAAVDTEEAPTTPAPAFDEVRRESDGMTVIAGRAAPGAEVKILRNGIEVARSIADGSGKFATVAMIPPDGLGQVLSLSQQANGAEQLSESEIILAPIAPPETAEVEIASISADAEALDSTASDAEDVMEDEAQPADVLASADEPVVETPIAEAEPANVETSAPAEEVVVAAVPEAVTESEPEPQPTKAEISTAAPEATAENAADALQATQEVVAEVPQVVEEVKEEVVAALDPVIAEPAQPTASKPAPVAVLKSTAEGVELLNTPSPDAMTNVAIDTISYSDVGEVELAGRAQSQAASVRVYLDNNSVVNLPVDSQGRWRGELPDVDEGIYTLRVDEVAADGKITSRVETPFKREAAEVLAAASASQDGPLKAITVQKGATLWAIARERYGDGELYVRVFEANSAAIRDPDLIYPGQIFDLPD